MPAYFLYLLKLSISFGVLWLFYQLFLRRLTFYNWNRWYLLVYSLLCFVIPLIDISFFFRDDQSGESFLIDGIPVIWYKGAVQHASAAINAWVIIPAVLVAGSAFFLIRLIVRLASLKRIRDKAGQVESLPNSVPSGERTNAFIYAVDKPIIPFSFGHSIFINPRLHSKEEWREIVLHEYIHVRQRHTVDILLAELLCVLNWYNPFAWLIRFSIRQNLEFIADQQVVRNGSDRKEYQYHLLKVVGMNQYRIANQFNFTSLKKRIIMMNKNRSARLNLVRFIFIFPLLALLLLAFRNKYEALRIDLRKEAKPAEMDLKIGMMSAAGPLSTLRARVSGRDTVPGQRKDTLHLSPVDKLMISGHLEKVLYIVDDNKMPAGYKPDKSSFGEGEIVSIKVLKNKAASLYGEKSMRDVVIITTNRIEVADVLLSPVRKTGYEILPDSLSYFVVGVKSSETESQKIDPQTIKSIDVIKGNEATRKYGKEGDHGVIVIVGRKIDSPVMEIKQAPDTIGVIVKPITQKDPGRPVTP